MEACSERDQTFPGFSPRKPKLFLGLMFSTAEMQKVRVFGYVTTCRLDEPFTALQGTYCLSLQGSSSSKYWTAGTSR